MRLLSRRVRWYRHWNWALLPLPLAGCGDAFAPKIEESPPLARPDTDTSDERPSIVAPNRFFLHTRGAEPPPLKLRLDKHKALDLFGSWAKEIHLLNVDSTTLLENVLVMIRDACGTTWKNDQPDPTYDCQKTALGRSLGPNWRSSPEFALIRLLGTTPANAQVKGTPFEDLALLVNQNPNTFRFDFAQILADTLGLRRTDPLVPISVIVRSVQRRLLGTHPAVLNENGPVPVSLYDALMDFSPLADKLGPQGAFPYLHAGEHPGLLQKDDTSFHTHGDALGPDFLLNIEAKSNLRRVEGIDLSSGAGDMFESSARSPLSFDFEDARTFSVQGIADKPTIDMRLVMMEAPQMGECATNPECRPYFMGSVVFDAAKEAYGNREYHHCHVSFGGACLFGVEIGKTNGQSGYVVFTNSLGNVKTPPAQFIGNLLTDVALIQLHDPTGDGIADIAPGKARAEFTLRGVPIGLSGSDLVAQMRPMLEAQEQQLADIVVGNHWQQNDDLDFFVALDLVTKTRNLLFVAESDILPDPSDPKRQKPYTYQHPGFFSRPELSEASRISRRTIAGISDIEHEKWTLTPGSHVVYVEDDHDDVYELTIFVPDSSTFPIEVAVKRSGRSH